MTAGFIIIVAAALLLLALMTNQGQRRRPHARPRQARTSFNPDLVQTRWQTVEQMARSGGSGLRNAVSEADKLLDYSLRGRGYSGETMAERLKRAESRLSDREAVWGAHKLRNNLAHEVGFDLLASQAHEALSAFRQALVDLGVLS